MRDFKKIGRTLVSTSIIATTMVWSVGLVAWPSAASAAACPQLKAGQLVRFGNAKAQVSYMGSGNRWTFINNDALVSWRGSVAVKRVDATCAGSYPEAGVIGFRPGSRLVMNASAGGVFAVGPNNLLHKIMNPAVAKDLYSAGWQGLVSKLTDTQYNTLYTVGSPLDGSAAHDGMLVKKKGDKATWYVWGGELKMINGKLPAFLNRTVRTVAPEKLTSLKISNESITAAQITADPTQGVAAKVVESTPVSEVSNSSAASAPVVENKSAGTINSGLFHNANYTGPFPAPEGLVLGGTYGSDKFHDPTGSGGYRYHIQTAWEREVQCIDGSRTIDKSQGKTWEKGFWSGFNVAASVIKQIDPVFDDTPKGEGKGGKLYDTGYRAGYNYAWGGGTEPRFGCPPKDGSTDLTKYDTDGWRMYRDIDKLKTIRTMYSPAPASGPGNSSQSALGGESTSLTFDNYLDAIEKSTFNKKNDPINLSRIDFLEADTSAEELALGTEGLMKALFDQQKAESKRKYANTVVFMDIRNPNPLEPNPQPLIVTQTYGKNSFVVMQYIVATGGKWYLADYALRIDPKTNTSLLMYFYDPKDISNEAKNGLDLTKTPNGDFLTQFLTKLELVNY